MRTNSLDLPGIDNCAAMDTDKYRLIKIFHQALEGFPDNVNLIFIMNADVVSRSFHIIDQIDFKHQVLNTIVDRNGGFFTGYRQAFQGSQLLLPVTACA